MNGHFTNSEGQSLTISARDVSVEGWNDMQDAIDGLQSEIDRGGGGGTGTVFVSANNPFAIKPLYHHLNQENVTLIPAESLLDIAYAKKLGFDMIEVNPQLCSDGVYVCKHGSGGKLGAAIRCKDGTDQSNTLFSSVTSSWLRENITYNSSLEKNRTFIPTLDEFCAFAKQMGIKVKAGNNGNNDVLAVMRKYLSEDEIFLSGRNTRGNFQGLIEYIFNPTTTTVDTCISRCKIIGNPLVIVVEAGKFKNMSNDVLLELTSKAHKEGMLVSIVYPSGGDCMRALSHGVDAICSTTWDINHITTGNRINIGYLRDQQLVLGNGTTYNSTDDVIEMPTGGTITVSTQDYFIIAAMSIDIRYEGRLTFCSLTDYESDGSNVVTQNYVSEPRTVHRRTLMVTITATATTTIYDINIRGSIIM